MSSLKVYIVNTHDSSFADNREALSRSLSQYRTEKLARLTPRQEDGSELSSRRASNYDLCLAAGLVTDIGLQTYGLREKDMKYGFTAKGKPVFGLPGHPLAAYFVFRLLVCEALRTWFSLPQETPAGTAALGVNIPSNHGREEYLCVKKEADGTLLPLHTKSGVISVLSGADGFIRIPRDAEGLAKGTVIDYYGV